MAQKPSDMNLSQNTPPKSSVGGAEKGQSLKKEKKKEKQQKQEGEKKPQTGGQGQTQKHQGQGQVQKPQGQGHGPSAQGQVEGEAKPQKSKAELKAERRALQEAQRAAKEAAKLAGSEGKGPAPKSAPKSSSQSGKDTPSQPASGPSGTKTAEVDDKKGVKKTVKTFTVPKSSERKVRMFDHLNQYHKDSNITKSLKFSSIGIHPAIVKLGVQYAEGKICGANARCLALLVAFEQMLADYVTPPQKEISRDLEAKIKPCINFLKQCRLMAVGMGNAMKHFEWKINHLSRDLSETQAKSELQEWLDDYIKEKILLAGTAICKLTLDEKKIVDGDIIVTFGCSSLVKSVLCEAHNKGIQFRVIVVDGRPKMEGREMLRRLVNIGIKCSYVLITAASYAMQEATKVFLGAHAMLANGTMMARVGSSLVALIAKSYNIPVLVCCETYKFCERAQTDSFVFNELGDPSDLVSIGKDTSPLQSWRDEPALTLLNLVYDVTPQEYISLVITEIGLIPCTSVPVVLRMNQINSNET